MFPINLQLDSLSIVDGKRRRSASPPLFLRTPPYPPCVPIFECQSLSLRQAHAHCCHAKCKL